MTAGGRHVGVAQHPRDLFDPRLTQGNLHITRGNATLLRFLHHELLISMHRDLRQMSDDERLPS